MEREDRGYQRFGSSIFLGETAVQNFIRSRSRSRDVVREAVVDPDDNVPDTDTDVHSQHASSRDSGHVVADPYESAEASNPTPEAQNSDSSQEMEPQLAVTEIKCVFCRRVIRSNWPVSSRWEGPRAFNGNGGPLCRSCRVWDRICQITSQWPEQGIFIDILIDALHGVEDVVTRLNRLRNRMSAWAAESSE